MTAEDKHDPADDAAWLRSLGDAAVEAPSARAPSASVPPLDRVRPERKPLVPRAVWMAALTGVALVAAVVGLMAWTGARSSVRVPAVTGLDVGVARTSLQRVGLKLEVTEERFNTSRQGLVLEQTPGVGEVLSRGGVVEVVVSAGTEELVMPDVVGDGITLAVGILGDLGLSTEIERVVSEEPSDTVLSSMPSAGSPIRTGDTVRLQVASPRGTTIDLRPYRMDGVIVTIDPAPMPSGVTGDPVLEVARRLEAILGASGARVVLLRSALDTDTADSVRAERAAESSPTVCVGLSVKAGGEAGLVVSVPPTQTPGIGLSASRLGAGVGKSLASSAGPVRSSQSSYDPVLTPARAPWIRVLLGSAEAREDVRLFADPDWADRVARALYASLAEIYGQEVTP